MRLRLRITAVCWHGWWCCSGGEDGPEGWPLGETVGAGFTITALMGSATRV